MTDKQCKITVEIFGENYNLKGDAQPDNIIKAAALLDRSMRELARNQPRLSVAKIAVLSALTMAEEYLRLKEDYQQLVKMVREQR